MAEIISVIVPIYKVEAYLRHCVDSILAQTYAALEVVLVDDGSPDGCGDICDEYARADARVRVIHKRNGGLSDARNAGIEAATGAYFAFIDSDDCVHPRMLELLFAALTEADADIAMCGYQRVSELRRVYEPVRPCAPVVFARDAAILRQLDKAHSESMTVAWNKLYRRAVFEGVRYPVGRNNEDYAVIYRLLYAARRVAAIDTELYYYLQRATGIMGQDNHLGRSVLTSLRECKQFFWDLHEETLYKAACAAYLRKIIWYYNRIAARADAPRDTLAQLAADFRACRSGGDYAPIAERAQFALFAAGPGAYALCWRGLSALKRAARGHRP